MNITNTVKYIGVNDHKADLFEGQYKIPNGMSYNSYAIIDEKIAIMDTVDGAFKEEWLGNIKSALNGKAPDYLIVLHMEPDHSANILNFSNEYPDAKIVASAKAFNMMKNFFGVDFSDKGIVVGENDTLSLGSRNLTFLTAPMVHWPEVIVAYDDKEKVLFSADGFGKFGALDADEEWIDEARRYYVGIVGKYGSQVQALLKKADALEINMICPLHGPVLNRNIKYYLDLYNIWSSYEAEEDGVAVIYTSIYGNTKEAAELLYNRLTESGQKAEIYDLARCDMSDAVSSAFKFSKTVLASPTYNADVFPFMKEFINHLTERNFQNRAVAFIENGSWAPMAAKAMRASLEKSKNLTYAKTEVRIMSALNIETKNQIEALKSELCE